MYAIKTDIAERKSKSWFFSRQKTMYGGKHIAEGDVIFVLASESDGGSGLIARGIVTSARAIPLRKDLDRQTPRVSITVKRTKLAKRPLGRAELKPFTNWK